MKRCDESCVGEAEYGDDQQKMHGELYGVFVQTTVANAKIVSVDATRALVSHSHPNTQKIYLHEFSPVLFFVLVQIQFVEPCRYAEKIF